MANTFKLTIVSPDGKKLVDDATICNVVTTNGTLGIMAHHLPLVGIIEISHLVYRNDNETHEFAISGGVLNVKDDEVIILAESFETPEEIDFKRAEEAKARAEKYLKSKDPNVDMRRAELALKRALNRINFK